MPYSGQDETNTSESQINKILSSRFLTFNREEQLSSDVIEKIIKECSLDIANSLSNKILKEKLEILFDYEKQYLELTKEYKEEIKFAASLQEDIRKERSKFFSETLKEVHRTLEEVKMDKKAIDLWITELVDSYTKSLDVSSSLSKDHILEMIGTLRSTSNDTLEDVKNIQD